MGRPGSRLQQSAPLAPTPLHSRCINPRLMCTPRAAAPPAPARQVDSIDASTVAADGSGYITVLATVTESAGLWASNGKQADSYHTVYQVGRSAASFLFHLAWCAGGRVTR